MTAVAHAIGSAAIPQAVDRIPPTPKPDLDRAIGAVADNKDAWIRVSIDERIALLDRLRESTGRVAARWVEAAHEAKSITPGTAAAAEEWLGGPFVTLRNLRLFARSLRDVRAHGVPQLPGKAKVNRFGKTVAPVFPTDVWDKVMYGGLSAEIWMQEGVTPDNLPRNQAEAYRHKAESGKVALVLGAGNVSSIAPMDALSKLFVEDQVVVLKMNPVNAYVGPFIEEAFAELVERGFFRVVYGGAEVGAYCCEHELIDEIHITGSDKTHDAIVWGRGEEGRKNKAAGTPRNNKRMTSELGNVSPVIVVPGPWTEADLKHHGASLATMLANNAGFNCNATRVIIQHKAWKHRQGLVDQIRSTFQKIPTRHAYYPGADERHAAFVSEHPEAEQVGDGTAGRLPWTMITDVDPNKSDDICFQTEAFCSVFSEVGLEASDAASFLRQAVAFCNDTLWGTLNASILIHPKSLKDPATKAAFEQAIADLEYGAICINDWPALSYGLVSTTWGAHPGHTLDDVQSGIGVVHNSYLFDKPLKSVIYAPFKPFPKPVWSALNKTSHVTARKVTEWEQDPSLIKALGIVGSAVRG